MLANVARLQALAAKPRSSFRRAQRGLRTCACGVQFYSSGLNTKQCRDCQRETRRQKTQAKLDQRRRLGPKAKAQTRNLRQLQLLVTSCEVCGSSETELKKKNQSLHGHHIVARSVLKKLKLESRENENFNGLGLCSSCHTRAGRGETMLDAGDVVGARSEWNRLGLPMDRVDRALVEFGLWEGQRPPNWCPNANRYAR